MLPIRYPTPSRWTAIVLGDLDAFLVDHAGCERKAFAQAMSLVAHYPDKTELCRAMIALAHEELDHFGRCFEIVTARGLLLGRDVRDVYVNRLRQHLRQGTPELLMDQLLISALIEARSCERFMLLAEALEPGPLKDFYQGLIGAEARHHGLFGRLARTYFDPAAVDERLDELLDREAAIVRELPLEPRVH
jgi:tRNA-(ms[2]io[6]A)-hydroxylase